MPAVDVAMARSVRRGILDILEVSLGPALHKRDLVEQVNDVKTSFSSWDNCMKANYCKWPVIAGIVIGGLIVVSVIWCIIRCACCGLSCCCSFFQCLKCCGNCCGCCDPPGGRKHKYLEAPYVPPNQGYKSHAAMDPDGIPGMHRTVAATTATAHAPPQYAEFDVSKKGPAKDEDALPQMPGWETSARKKVEVEDEGVELEQLKKPESNGQDVSLMTGARVVRGPASPGPRPTPVEQTPYGAAGAAAASSGYFAGAGAHSYGQRTPGYNQHPNSPYGPSVHAYAQAGAAHGQGDQGYNHGAAPYSRSTTPLGSGASYGPAAAAAMIQGRQSPHAYGGWGRQDSGFAAPARGAPFAQNGTPRQGSFDSYRQPGRPGYGMEPLGSPRPLASGGGGIPSPTQSNPVQFADAGYQSARGSPAPQRARGPNPGYGGARSSPAPQGEHGGYRRPYPTDSHYSSDPSWPHRQNSQQTHTEGSLGSPASLHNTAGFDFNGYSRPGTSNSHRSPNAAAPPGLQQQQQSAGQPAAYQGYRPYQPGGQPGGWGGS